MTDKPLWEADNFETPRNHIIGPLVARLQELAPAILSRSLSYKDAVASASEWEEIEEQLASVVPLDVDGVFALAACLSADPVALPLKDVTKARIAANLEAARPWLTRQDVAFREAYVHLRRLVAGFGILGAVLRGKLDVLFQPLAEGRDARTLKGKDAALARTEAAVMDLSEMVSLQQATAAEQVAVVAQENDRCNGELAILGDLATFVVDRDRKDRADGLGPMN